MLHAQQAGFGNGRERPAALLWHTCTSCHTFCMAKLSELCRRKSKMGHQLLRQWRRTPRRAPLCAAAARQGAMAQIPPPPSPQPFPVPIPRDIDPGNTRPPSPPPLPLRRRPPHPPPPLPSHDGFATTRLYNGCTATTRAPD
ncbi:hypothetical protein ABPG75_006205 [Micractinium tetrahymenae]